MAVEDKSEPGSVLGFLDHFCYEVGADMSAERVFKVILRPGTLEDASACGAIAFEAFGSIASEHDFPWDFPSAEAAVNLMRILLPHPGFYSVVAGKSSAAIFSITATPFSVSARSPSRSGHRIWRSAGG